MRGSPVCTRSWAGAWLNWSVFIDLMRHRSSISRSRCGSRSEIQVPFLPVWWKGNCGPSIFGTPVMKAKRLPLRKDSGQSWPLNRAQRRLVVEQFELAGRAAHMQIDHPLGLGGELRRQHRQRRGGIAREIQAGRRLPAAAPHRPHSGKTRPGRRRPSPRTGGGSAPDGPGDCSRSAWLSVPHGRHLVSAASRLNKALATAVYPAGCGP